MVTHYSSPDAFVGDDRELALYFGKDVCVCVCFELMLPLLYLKLVCNNYV
jgi:hypothetical protein